MEIFHPKQKAEFNRLLFQLNELLVDPPIVLDLYTWIEDVERKMNALKKISPDAFERLEDLVVEAVRRAEQHIGDLDADEAPSVVGYDQNLYFAQVGLVQSEINRLKQL